MPSNAPSDVPPQCLIQVDDVGVTYAGGAVTALHRCSLAVGRGEFTVLLGHSGAGKSTLLRCLNRLVPPTSGRVVVDGLGDLTDRLALHRHRRQTGMVFQQHQLIARHSALTNVLLGRIGYHPTWRTLLPLGRGEQRVALECLDRVGLLHKALDRVDNLSGGEQQRVGIARALAQQPKIVLADEPVASLDPATARRVLTLLHDVCRQDRITAVVSLHQVELAKQFADRVVGLAGGRVVFDGPPQELSADVVARLYHAGNRDVAPGDNPAEEPDLDDAIAAAASA
ncbi:MAG TPA: phosphonate ABC transporter ATP-binding protein [Tepidisphaeraceae bacterium]|nr:phosphonate ABC transporter ATP-binding protein [Tepidisphaeraceae bacterium]